MPRQFKVTFYVTVTNARDAIKAAREQAESFGCPRSNVRNTSDAVHYLIDNIAPETRPGVSIEATECEEYTDLY